jgi:hypothetical protein
VDGQGNTITREEDVNSLRFFEGLAEGDTLPVLYQRARPSDSYPLERIRADLKISRWICYALVLFWAAMGAYLLR